MTERPRQPLFAPDNFSQNKTYSETKAAEIDEEIARVIDEAHKRVQTILTERRKVLDDLARLLSEKEIVQGDELRSMLSAFTPEASKEPPAAKGPRKEKSQAPQPA